MRTVLGILVTLCFCVTAGAQDKLQILSADHEPRKMLYRFMMGEAQKHFEARKQLVASLKTPDEIQKRQRDLKAKFIDAIGGFPLVKSPLNAQVVGKLKGAGFTVENVIYESRPNHHVTANFYLPEGKGPFPGVLVPCGHSENGKAADAYQRACILMAKNGLAVLCYDPIGQGERLQLLAPGTKAAIKGSTSEHTMVGVGALLVGQSTAGYRIWDGIRSIDYLVSRPEVDFNKIGCTGNSGGGTLTAYLMALDDRIACAAPSCYITSLERLLATIGPQDAEQNIPGQVAFGMDHVDYMTMRAPKPTLMCIASQDYFDQQGSWATFREASQVFAKMGHGERVALFEYDDKHGFSRPRREAAMRWMRRWLLNVDDAPTEGDLTAFKDADLQCTRSGQVLADFKGISAFGLNVLEAKKYEARRTKFANLDEKTRQAEIRRLIGLPGAIPTARLVSQKIHYLEDRLSTHKVVYETEKGILIPGLRFKHIQPKGPPVIHVPDNGLPADGKLPRWLVEKYEKKHHEIYIFDLRGLGETSPGAKSAYFGADIKEAFLAMHLNRPLLGQRVLDLLSVIQSIKSDQVHVVAAGVTAHVALHSAALDDRIREVSLDGKVRPWLNVVQTPITYNELTNVVPGVLRVYDLPDLEATLAPRKVTTREILN